VDFAEKWQRGSGFRGKMAEQKKTPVCIVVGVGGGLGSSLAKRFAAAGYSIGLVAREKQHLDPVQKQLEEKGHKCLSVPADAADSDQLTKAIKEIQAKLGHVEVLCYNASGFVMASALDLKLQQMEGLLKVGVLGLLAAAQAVLPDMLASKKGSILVSGATASLRGGSRFAGLAVPKFGMRALAQSMAREFGPQGIHVAHFVIDGQINTPRQMKEAADRPINSFLNSDAIADTYYHVHAQPVNCWAFEMDLRPSVEKW